MKGLIGAIFIAFAIITAAAIIVGTITFSDALGIMMGGLLFLGMIIVIIIIAILAFVLIFFYIVER